MSRTKHHRGQKGRNCGRDLWSRRPFSGNPFNAWSKKMSRRLERARKRRDIEKELEMEELK